MALVANGQIALADIQSEFGGSAPISISEYYLNGGKVPNSIEVPTTQYWYEASGYTTSYGVKKRVWTSGPKSTQGTSGYDYTWTWNNSVVSQASPPQHSGASSIAAGGNFYAVQFSSVTTITSGATDKSTGHTYYERGYKIGKYETRNLTTAVNGSVPTAGEIGFSDFYGGRKT